MEFDARKIREEQTPPITRTWMAKKMGVTYNFLYYLERGSYPWPPKRKAQFEQIVAEWKVAPPTDPRQQRSDFGKKHRRRKRVKAPVKTEPVPVPHSHGEVVGIG